MSTQTLDKVEIDPTTGVPRLAHIVKPKDGRTGADLVLEARIFGLEVQALCGHRFVPSRDPKQHPACPECVRLFEERTGAQDGWEES